MSENTAGHYTTAAALRKGLTECRTLTVQISRQGDADKALDTFARLHTLGQRVRDASEAFKASPPADLGELDLFDVGYEIGVLEQEAGQHVRSRGTMTLREKSELVSRIGQDAYLALPY